MQRLWQKSPFERFFDFIVVLLMMGAGVYGLLFLLDRFSVRMPYL